MSGSEGELITTLRYTGGQFDLRGFPAANADELRHYRDLFVAASKTVWRRNNPNRHNLPSGFEDNIRLSFVIEEGSSVAACISHVTSEQQRGFVDLEGQTQERINQIFASMISNGSLDDVEDEEIPHLKRVGSTFTVDEALILRDGSDDPIRYDVASRKRLLATLEANSKHATIIGRIVSLDVSLHFAVRPLGHRAKLVGHFTDEGLFPDFHAVLDVNSDDTSIMWLDCEMELSPRTHRPRVITEVHAVGTFPSVHPEDEADIASLAQHADGWFDGEGSRLSPDTLENAVHLLNALRNVGLPRATIGGDPDGGVTLQWTNDPVAVLVIVEPDGSFTALRASVDAVGEDYQPGLAGVPAAVGAVREMLGL